MFFVLWGKLIQKQYRVYFSTCSLLVEQMLRAKQEMRLDRFLKKLSNYHAVIIDDIGYVQHNREEMDVLFTLLSYRYERGSVMLTSNLLFSQWEKIFKDPMTTAAVYDMKGKIVQSARIISAAGSANRYSFNCTNISNGYYILIIHSGNRINKSGLILTGN